MTYLRENNLQEYSANTLGKYIVVFIFSLFLQLYSLCVSQLTWILKIYPSFGILNNKQYYTMAVQGDKYFVIEIK